MTNKLNQLYNRLDLTYTAWNIILIELTLNICCKN